MKKNEFHFTIIGRQTWEEIIELIKDFNEKKRSEILQKIEELWKNTQWNIELKNEFYYIKKDYKDPETPDIRESIIQIAEIDKITELYQKLNLLLNTQFETPLPHVTLYTNSTRAEKKLYWIGIYSKKQFNKLETKKI